MENRRRRRVSPFPYLILNILLSALTTLAVLWLWNRVQAQKLPDDAAVQALLQNSTRPTEMVTPVLLAPLPSLDTQVIEIINVFGAGDVENEEIVLQNISQEEEIWLDGWTLTTSGGDSYTFKSLVLNPNARVQIYTRPGHDTVNKLYWNLNTAALESGGKITLEDYEGNLRAVFSIP
ncbi:MAG: lamin tail domain-containing protein [Chloroflexi bacterium]|nr:lamin tail domain-containing protein [Chloroflexota bacterium]